MVLISLVSHPSWVCGLKHFNYLRSDYWHLVTPFVGVWIETSQANAYKEFAVVTPFVGVWIETLS